MQFGGRRERKAKDHQEYEERQKRVTERRDKKWMAEQEAGWTCQLEQCCKHFTEMIDFHTHVSEHKKDMERRMVCNQDKCGQKFNTRRDFSNHVIGHREALKTKLINSIRSVLLYNKHGLLLEAFEREFKGMTGKSIPYKPLGFSSVYELVNNLPDVVAVQELDGGHKLLLAVPDDKTAHMARMVGSQRNNDEGFNRMTREVLRNQGDDVFRNIDRLAGRGDRKVSTHAQEQVKELLSMDEYTKGLELVEFQRIYDNEFGYKVEFRDLGFYSLEDFVYHGLANCAQLVLESSGFWKVSSLKKESANVASLVQSSVQEVPSEVRGNISILLSTRPIGIEISSLPMVYSLYGNLDPRQMGFEDIVELCSFMPDVCTVTVDGKDVRIMPPVNNVANKCQGSVPDWIERNIKRVLFKYPEGVITSCLLNCYDEIIGESLDPIDLGFSSLCDLLNSLIGKIVNIDFPGSSSEKVTLHKHCKNIMTPVGSDKSLLLLNQLSVSGIKEVVIQKSQWVKVLRFGPPGYVVIRPQCLELYELEEHLERQITRELTGVEIRSEELVAGLIVAALHVDICWHRAVVARVVEQEKMVEIRYIDHGWRAKVRADSLRRLSRQFGDLPAQAIEVQLAGVKPTSSLNILGDIQEMGWFHISGKNAELFASMVLLNTELKSVGVCHLMNGSIDGHMDKINIQETNRGPINVASSNYLEDDMTTEEKVINNKLAQDKDVLRRKVFESYLRLQKSNLARH